MQVEIRAYGSNATEFVVSTSSERSIQILRYFCELRNFMIVMSVGFAAAIWCSTFNMALKWIWSVLVMVCFVYVASFGFVRLMDWNVQKGRTYLMNWHPVRATALFLRVYSSHPSHWHSTNKALLEWEEANMFYWPYSSSSDSNQWSNIICIRLLLHRICDENESWSTDSSFWGIEMLFAGLQQYWCCFVASTSSSKLSTRNIQLHSNRMLSNFIQNESSIRLVASSMAIIVISHLGS